MKINFRDFLNNTLVEKYKNYIPEAKEEWRILLTKKDEKNNDDINNGKIIKKDFGVDGSTIRAISTGIEGSGAPLTLYNEWAFQQTEILRQKKPNEICLSEPADFEEWHKILVDSLVAKWNSVAKAEHALSIPHRYKLVDLFVRWLAIYEGKNFSDISLACQRFGHIPLDKKSLHVLSETFGGIGLEGKFSMGNVHTVTAYKFYQQLALQVCKEVGGSPLLFDIFSWKHPDAQALYK